MLKIAHRGSSGKAPENTFQAFDLALKQGADAIELDIRQTGTGDLIVFHDETIERLTGINKKIRNMTLSAIQGLGLNIPTLTETIAFIEERIPLFIEVKEEDTAMQLYETLDFFFKRGWGYESLIVISSRFDPLYLLRQQNPLLQIGINIHEDRPLSDADWELNPISINPYYRMVTPDFVKNIQKKNVHIFPWTVNNNEVIGQLKEMGVSGIMSDYPDRL